MTVPSSSSISSSIPEIIRVALADDSAVVRGLLTRVLEEDPMIKVIATASNGEIAVKMAKDHTPDILILDIEMPVMDGITALPQIIKASPKTKVLMCSTLSLRNADITLKAFQMGATDAIAKPTAAGQILASDSDFKTTLINMVKQIAIAAARRKTNLATRQNSTENAAATSLENLPREKIPQFTSGGKFQLRDLKTAYTGKPAILAIGSSTGGPPALFEVLKHCKGLNVPIVITQHMPATFTAMLATHIQKNTDLKSYEGQEGMTLEPGCAYIAPGGFHMTIKMEEGKPVIRLNTNPAENFCRPAVDPMMRSLIEIYGNKVLGVILTGMGSDGFFSCRQLVESGGRLFAQNEETSVVWGMPGAVAMGGLCHSVLPLADLGPLIYRTIMMR